MTPYYARDGITIFHARCEDVLPSLRGIDLVFTSPPYNKGARYDGNWVGPPTTGSKGNRFRGGYDDHDDALPFPEYEAWQRHCLTLCWDAISDHGAIFYNHKPRVMNGLLWTPLAITSGLPLRQIITWVTGAGINIMPAAYTPAYEWILVFAKSAWRLRSGSASARSDVWIVPPERSDDHPAPFPVALPMIALDSTAARTVVDPFMGTGSTIVAAKSMGIVGIGIEKSERYCEIAARRLEQGVLPL